MFRPKHQHEESCLDGCTYYVIREGAADVNYVDASGKEISPEVALCVLADLAGQFGLMGR
jgi:peptide deformylase